MRSFPGTVPVLLFQHPAVSGPGALGGALGKPLDVHLLRGSPADDDEVHLVRARIDGRPGGGWSDGAGIRPKSWGQN